MNLWFLWLCLVFLACSNTDEGGVKDEDDEVVNEEDPLTKPRVLWFDAEANFERFATRDSIVFYLDKTKEAGFNGIVVDVRPIYGDALYTKTTILDPLTQIGQVTVERDWDYLQFFIDEARKRGLSVTVSATIFPAGRPDTKEGPVYRSDKWKDKTVMQHTPNGLIDIKDDPSKVAAFLNPVLPEVQDYALSFINEIVANYDIDGFCLDYCRYSSIEADFSDASRSAFEAYIGEKVVNFPSDIFWWEGSSPVLGRYGKRWFEFRAMVIHDFIAKTRQSIRKINPDIELSYWAASWYHALYAQGQNWGSKNYDPSVKYSYWASPGYKNAGFAEHLDLFMIGAYLPYVYGPTNPESIEYALARGKNIIDGECKMVGSISSMNYDTMEEAAYLCLKESGGLVVFDIVYVIQFNLWDDFQRAIQRYNAGE